MEGNRNDVKHSHYDTSSKDGVEIHPLNIPFVSNCCRFYVNKSHSVSS